MIRRWLMLAATLTAAVPAVLQARPGANPDWRSVLKARLGPGRSTRLRCLVRGKRMPRWGNLRSTQPFSTNWGIDRGTPIDRYYADRFFEKHASLITGRVLEIQDKTYTERYGRGVVEAHSVDIEPDFGPDIVCDLAKADSVIPSDYYDCFLLPFTLLVVQDLEAALRNALRIVRPGGVILATTTVLAPVLAEYPEYWRMTANGWKEVLARTWPGCDVQIESHGNCLAAVAEIMGLAQEELTTAELDVKDTRYPLVITIYGRKA